MFLNSKERCRSNSLTTPFIIFGISTLNLVEFSFTTSKPELGVYCKKLYIDASRVAERLKIEDLRKYGSITKFPKVHSDTA